MLRYKVRWLTYAEQQRESLPPDGRRALDELLDELTADPRARGTYDRISDQWTASFGGHGIVLYTVEDHWITVTVLRLAWLG